MSRLAPNHPAHKFTHTNDSKSLTALSRNFLRSFGPIADIRCWRVREGETLASASGENQPADPKGTFRPAKRKRNRGFRVFICFQWLNRLFVSRREAKHFAVLILSD
jgi:hypothetical protein